MKQITQAVLLIFAVSVLLSMKSPATHRVIFFGDSITQMGVNPDGYIDVLKKKLSSKATSSELELIGAGVGGNKIYDLYLRLERDVLDNNPSVVFIYVGINDVWHKTSGTGTDIDKFAVFYRAIIAKLQMRSIRVVMCTPTVIGEKLNNANPQDQELNAFADVIRKIAVDMNCELVDLRKTFIEYLKTNNPQDAASGILTTDRVHLNKKGNELVAADMFSLLTTSTMLP